VHLFSLRPEDSLTILLMALLMGFGQSVSLLPAILANGFWLLPMQVYLLLNTPAFSGRTTVREVFPHTAFPERSLKALRLSLSVQAYSFSLVLKLVSELGPSGVPRLSPISRPSPL
jgi:hypothetical protein